MGRAIARGAPLVRQAVVEERALEIRQMTVEIRPAGIVAMDLPIVQATRRAVTLLSRAPYVTFGGASTDSNLAM
jgi:tripeptide aminopeptidase